MNNNFQITTDFFVGNPFKGNWTGIIITPEESKNVKKFGQLFVVMSLSAPSNFDSKIAGDLLLENIQDTYYDEQESDEKTLSRIEKSIMSTAKKLQYLLEREEIASEEGIDLNVIVVVIKEKYIYMAILGEGGIAFAKKEKLIFLSSELKDLTGRSYIRSGSGIIKDGDRFILLSPNAQFNLSENELKRCVRKDSFTGLEHKKDEPLFGVLMIRIGYKDKSIDEVNQREKVYHASKDFDELNNTQNVKKDDLKLEEEPVLTKDEDIGYLKQENKILHKTNFEERRDTNDGQNLMDGSKSEIQQDTNMDRIKKVRDKIKEKISDKKTYEVIFIKTKEIFIKLFVLLKKYVWSELLGLGGGGLYLRGANRKKSIRGIVILILIIASLLFLSIRGVKKHIETSDRKDEILEILSSVEGKITNGRGLGEAGNIAESTRILEEAKSDLERAKSFGIMLKQIEEKESEIISLLDEIKKVVIVTEKDKITDVAGYIEGATVSDFEFLNGTLYIIDSVNSSIYEVGTNGGEVKIFIENDPNIKTPLSIVFDSKGDMLLYDNNLGIVKVLMAEKKVTTLPGLSSSSVGEVVEISNYVDPAGNDFLYLLRPSNKDVRKISKVASGYTWPDLRLSDQRLSDAVDLEIDWKIYLLSSQYGILRYYVNAFEPYTLLGLDKPVDNSSCIEIDPLFLYFGDSINKRIVVVSKGNNFAPNQGHYIAQIVYRGEGEHFGNIKELQVDHKSRTLFVLDGTSIFKISLDKVDEYGKAFI